LYRIEDAEFEHADPTGKHLRPYIDGLKESILVEGLHNPLLVSIREDGPHIHPGKCRAKALLELGWTHAPAVVVDYRRVVDADAIEQPSVFLEDIEEVAKLFSGDCVVQMCHRWLTIKKTRRG
jgi:ParB-like chromosome segregation protein Spo0J